MMILLVYRPSKNQLKMKMISLFPTKSNLHRFIKTVRNRTVKKMKNLQTRLNKFFLVKKVS